MECKMNRLDKYLLFINPNLSRTRANQLIKDGMVQVNSRVVLKPSLKISETDVVEICDFSAYYVSRAGLKLESALDTFSIDVEGFTCLDIGASTGGFTECLLRRGASKVYALDVGSSQLDISIKNNPKVISIENTNARYINEDIIKEKVDFICVDVSFISLSLIIPAMKKVLKKNAESVVLIKPQFELEKSALSKKGIVKNEEFRQKALIRVRNSLKENGFKETAFMESPIKGFNGNIEYLMKIEL